MSNAINKLMHKTRYIVERNKNVCKSCNNTKFLVTSTGKKCSKCGEWLTY